MEVKYQVFVSSTYEDLKDERKEISQAILESNCIPAGMELFPASNQAQWEVIKRVIDDSDFYLLILAGKYGSLGKDESGNEVGYTEMEFDYALKTGKPVLALVHENIEELPRSKTETTSKKDHLLKLFREKVYQGRLIKKWSNKDNLKSAALTALAELKRTTDAPGWVRADYKVEQQMYDLLEQQRRNYEEKIRGLNDALDQSDAARKKAEADMEELRKYNQALDQQRLTSHRENLRLFHMLAQEKDFWTSLLQIITAYRYSTESSAQLLDDMRQERPLSDPELWFLRCHGSRELWTSVMSRAEDLLKDYECLSDKERDNFLYNNMYNSIINKATDHFSSGTFDPYIMEDEEVVELVSPLFFLLKLCQRYRFSNQFLVLLDLANRYTTLCNAILNAAWEAELALRENDS